MHWITPRLSFAQCKKPLLPIQGSLNPISWRKLSSMVQSTLRPYRLGHAFGSMIKKKFNLGLGNVVSYVPWSDPATLSDPTWNFPLLGQSPWSPVLWTCQAHPCLHLLCLPAPLPHSQFTLAGSFASATGTQHHPSQIACYSTALYYFPHSN